MNLTLESLLQSNNEQPETGFFTDESPEGYETKANFKQYLLEQKQKGGPRNWRINHINSFFQNAKQGRRLVRMPEEIWEDGEKWMWCNFNLGKVTQGLKIPAGGGMHDLIKDYANGQVKVNYNLEELLQQAVEA